MAGSYAVPAWGERSAHLATFAAFTLFAFYAYNGQISIHADCVLESSHDWRALLERSYLNNASGRGYLRIAYSMLYEATGNSFPIANAVFLATHVLTAFAWYLVLTRVFSAPTALLGGLCYLTYPTKYEAMFGFLHGGHLVVTALLPIAFWLTTTRLRVAWQALLIGLIVWLSLHWYETLLIALPAFSIFWISRRLLERQQVTPSLLLASAIPFLLPALHTIILSTSRSPVWNRDHTSLGLNLLYRATRGFENGIDATIGQSYVNLVKFSVRSFFSDFARDLPALLFLLAACCAALLLALTLGTRRAADKPRDWPRMLAYAFAGGYLLLFGAFPSFVLGIDFAVSRLTIVSSTGIMLLGCVLFEFALGAGRRGPFFTSVVRWGVGCGIVGMVVVNAISMSSINQQFLDTYRFDKLIALEIVRIHPVVQSTPKCGFGDGRPDCAETVLVDLPYLDRAARGVWYAGHSHLEIGNVNAAATLWHHYHIKWHGIGYERVKRLPNARGYGELVEPVRRWIESGTHDVTPFYVDDNWRVRGIRSIRLLSPEGGVVAVLDFPRLASAAAADLMTIEMEYRLIK